MRVFRNAHFSDLDEEIIEGEKIWTIETSMFTQFEPYFVSRYVSDKNYCSWKKKKKGFEYL